MQKSTDVDGALLEYRNMSITGNKYTAPAWMLNRQLRTKIHIKKNYFKKLKSLEPGYQWNRRVKIKAKKAPGRKCKAKEFGLG